jgi:hypothetical protein
MTQRSSVFKTKKTRCASATIIKKKAELQIAELVHAMSQPVYGMLICSP